MFSGAETDSPPDICSVRVTVQLAVPYMFAVVLKVRCPVAPIAGASANRLAPDAHSTVKASVSDSPRPEEISVAHAALYAPESSATDISAPAVNDGGSFSAANSVRVQHACHHDFKVKRAMCILEQMCALACHVWGHSNQMHITCNSC
jgi:hypothetical protein